MHGLEEGYAQLSSGRENQKKLSQHFTFTSTTGKVDRDDGERQDGG
jgi:hypothetical protein